MKKLMMFSAAIVLALTVAAEGEAASVPTFTTFNSQNTLGIQRVAKGELTTTVPVTFKAVGGGTVNLADTMYLDNLNMADTVQVMLNASSSYYTQWIWLPGVMTNLYWTARRNGETEVLPTGRTLPYGTGLRVSLANSSTPVYTIGEYKDANNTISFRANRYYFLSNPSSTESLDLEKVFVGNGVTPLDSLFISDGNQELVYHYDETGDSNGKHWYRTEIQHVVNGDRVAQTQKDVYDLKAIPPGGGFRYYCGFWDWTFTW